MNRIKYIFALTICLAIVRGVSAQSVNIDDVKMNWEAGFDAGLNTDGYQFNFSISYFPISYVGMKAAIGFDGEIERLEDWDIDWYDGEFYPSYNPDRDYTVRFIFNPAIVLRSPCIIKLKGQDAGFHLFAEPGILLSPGASGSRNARTVHWNIRTGINMQMYRFIVGIGYGLSNFSLYSGEPYNENGLPANPNHNTHSGFITAAVKF